MPPMGVLARTVSSAASSQVVSVSLVMNTRATVTPVSTHRPSLLGFDGLQRDDECGTCRFLRGDVGRQRRAALECPFLVILAGLHEHAGDRQRVVRLDLLAGVVAHKHDAALRRFHERAGDDFAATLPPAQIDRRIDKCVVRASGEAEWITGSDFAEVVRHG
jgi:hypothetical protein